MTSADLARMEARHDREFQAAKTRHGPRAPELVELAKRQLREVLGQKGE